MESQHVQAFFDDVYRPLRLRGRSPNTVRLYRNTFKQFGRYLGRPPKLSDLDELTVSAYLSYRSDQGRSAYTVEKERNQLMAIGRLAAERRVIDMAPHVPQSVLPKVTPTAWTLPQLKALMHSADNTPGMVGTVPAAIWWGALVHVCWETSERIGAIMACTRANFDGRTLLVPAEARKGRRQDRVYRLTERTCQRLQAVLRRHNEQMIFHWPHPKTHLWYWMGKIIKRAGLNPKRMKFHAIRRSAASHFAAHGGNATAFLGHSSPRITQEFYLDPRIADTGPQPCDVLPDVG